MAMAMLLDSCAFRVTSQGLECDREKPLITCGNIVKWPNGGMTGDSAKADACLPPERRRRQASERAKLRAERSQAFVAHVEADVRDAVVASQQEPLCGFNAQASHKFVRGLAKSPRE